MDGSCQFEVTGWAGYGGRESGECWLDVGDEGFSVCFTIIVECGWADGTVMPGGEANGGGTV